MSEHSLSAQNTVTHAAYADPIGGGWDGYQGACHDCDWRAAEVHSDKDKARADAGAHIDEVGPLDPLAQLELWATYGGLDEAKQLADQVRARLGRVK